MTTEKLAKLQMLQKQVAEMEHDPDVRKEMERQALLKESGGALDMSSDEMADILMPRLAGEKPILSVRGLNSVPTQDSRKCMLHFELLHLAGRIQERLEELSTDPVIEHRTLLLSELDDMGLTPMQAASLLAPVRAQRLFGAKKKRGPEVTDKPKRRRVTRYWKNPHTGEMIAARSTGRMDLKRWSKEYGSHILEDWQITEEEYTGKRE